MSSLAQMLAVSGVQVTGTDTTNCPTVKGLRRLGIHIHSGHTPAPFVRESEFVFVGSGAARIHPDRLRARRVGVREDSPARWLRRYMQEHVGLAIAGQRDASVASAMVGWILTNAGLDPTVLVGMAVPQLGGWARVGAGSHLVMDALEADGDLGPFGPRVAVLLNTVVARGIDPAVRTNALHRFAASVPSDGLILVEEPNQVIGAAVQAVESTVESVSLARGSSWWGTDLRHERGRYRFRVFHQGHFTLEVGLQVPGRRNVLSAVVAVAACVRLGVSTSVIREGLEEFTGVSRDFESRGSYRGVTLVDDDSRDPVTIAESLATGRQVFGSRRLRVVFWTNSTEWSPEDVGRYTYALSSADHVVIMDVSDTETSRSGTETLLAELAVTGVQTCRVESFEGALRNLDQHLEPGDVLVTLGAGDVGTIADAFIRRLSRNRQG